MEDPYPPSDFDQWADTYDASVASNSGFPFEGYAQVLDQVVQFAAPGPGMAVLDLGTGTGLLAERFSQLGCNLWCTDFSPLMLEKARARLPQANFALHDLRQPWTVDWRQRFDRIVSAYVFHHFEDGKKIELIQWLIKDLLSPHGRLVIADISFPNPVAWQAAAARVGSEWEEELYWAAEPIIARLQGLGLAVDYRQVSYCAGVYCIQPGSEFNEEIQ